MEKEKINREKWLHLRLTGKEQSKILKNYAGTTHDTVSDYARAILLGKPMIAAVRNQSLQEILAELSALRKDLHGVANNFNQAVHKLHTLDHIPQIQSWVLSYELDKKKLLKEVQQIREYIDQTVEKWLQS
jgi:hypothetical protein